MKLTSRPYLTNSKYERTGVKAPDAPQVASVTALWGEELILPEVSLDTDNNKVTVSSVPTGNTVVAIKDNLGTILWSYHIWKPEIDEDIGISHSESIYGELYRNPSCYAFGVGGC